MRHPDYRVAPGLGERGQQPIEDIPIDTEAFLRWGTTLHPDHPYRYELSNQPHDDPSVSGTLAGHR